MWKTVISLDEMASDAEKRKRFIEELCALIDQEITALKGVRGLIVKRAYATIKAVRQGYVEHLIMTMADDFVSAYERIHADYRSGLVLPTEELFSFVNYLQNHSEDYYAAFLSVSNNYAKCHAGAIVSLAYRTLRPHMKLYIIDSIPLVGALIESYTVLEVDA